MYIPEYEEQVVHNALQDIEVPFSQYTERYMDKINRESVFKKYRINKRNNAEAYYHRMKSNSLIAKEKLLVYSKHISKRLDGRENELRSLLENKDYDTLKNEFKDYISLQSIKNVRRYNLLVPISDKNLATLLFTMIDKGKYFNASRFLNIRKIKEEPLSDELIEIENIIEICRQLSIDRYDKKDSELVKSLIETHSDDYPDLIDIYRSRLWIMEMDAKSKENYKAIEDLSEEILEKYPFDGETMAIQAKAKMELGNVEEAMELYKKAIYNTRNGLIWQKVEDETGISRIDIERDLIEEQKIWKAK